MGRVEDRQRTGSLHLSPSTVGKLLLLLPAGQWNPCPVPSWAPVHPCQPLLAGFAPWIPQATRRQLPQLMSSLLCHNLHPLGLLLIYRVQTFRHRVGDQPSAWSRILQYTSLSGVFLSLSPTLTGLCISWLLWLKISTKSHFATWVFYKGEWRNSTKDTGNG